MTAWALWVCVSVFATDSNHLSGIVEECPPQDLRVVSSNPGWVMAKTLRFSPNCFLRLIPIHLSLQAERYGKLVSAIYYHLMTSSVVTGELR